ncbi:MAG: 4Fe-4S dicluster domain-containing protein [Planctomycetota bacterium]|jgi:anaerobic dimethyl sulfoxide reductase subunit B (iron-sulfur subunit)
MTQYGFFVDLSRCIGCNGCVIACKQWHDIPPGPVKWMRVYQWESGNLPYTRIHLLPIMCYHCENPICAKACPHGALFKEEKYGAVLVIADKCQGTRKCWLACPYGTPQFETDAVPSAKMSKCNMCIERLKDGLKPICVLSCSMRALEFGLLDEIIGKYGDQRKIEGMPKETITRPAVVFKPVDPKKQIVPWDHRRALELWQKRNSPSGDLLPGVFSDIADVTQAPAAIVGRNKLVLKAKSTEELMYYTMDDE